MKWVCQQRIKMHWYARILASSQAIEYTKKHFFQTQLGVEFPSYCAHFPSFGQITHLVTSQLLWLLFSAVNCCYFPLNTSLSLTNCCHTQAWNDPENTPSNNKTSILLSISLIFLFRLHYQSIRICWLLFLFQNIVFFINRSREPLHQTCTVPLSYKHPSNSSTPLSRSPDVGWLFYAAILSPYPWYTLVCCRMQWGGPKVDFWLIIV